MARADEIIRFAIDGDASEFDLSATHAKELRDAPEKFQATATPLGRYTLGIARGPALGAPAAGRP